FSALSKHYLLYGSIQDSLWVTAIIQTQYIFKFFAWEKGYMKCMDIAHDCACFYICWGCIAYIYVIFNTPTLYLAYNLIELGMGLSWILVIIGTFCIWLTYWIDMQKEIFRLT
ncbi:hypothetical protein, partial [Salmonella sp. s51228]|uniref:hypothetical protein n=1 Tax=Salmonella sp. s51228 TaxID=3159652 RepID=UPI00397FA89D